MRRAAARIGPALAAALVAITAPTAGCGGSEENAAPPLPSTTTTPQEAAAVPPGWERRLDTKVGYSIAIPPGWRAGDRNATTLVRSPDHLVAVSISADRTNEALAVRPEDFATRALAAQAGYEEPLQPTPARPFGGTPLDAVSTVATGTLSASGVEQRLRLVVLRRDDYVNFTTLVVANARRAPAAERDLALRMVRTLRDYPIGASPGAGNGA